MDENNCNHDFFLIDTYTVTDKKINPNTRKVEFSKKIGKTYTFACKFCLKIKQKTFYFAGGEKNVKTDN